MKTNKNRIRGEHIALCIVALTLALGLWLFVTAPSLATTRIDSSPRYSVPEIARPAVTTTTYLPLILKSYVAPVATVFGVQMFGDMTVATNAITFAQEARVFWVRNKFSWSAVEPISTTPPTYNLSVYDTSVAGGTQAGLRPIATIVTNPSWAATYPNGPIDKVDLSRFTSFVSALVQHYNGSSGAPEIDYWEFYNEPDGTSNFSCQTMGTGCWGYYGAQYAQMLCAAYPAVKAANPRAQVWLGGMAYDWWTGPFYQYFLDDVLSNGGGQCFDVMNFHYYPAFAANWTAYGPGLSGKANYLRTKLSQFSLSKPLACTEVGWPSDIYDSTPEIQARYVPKYFSQARASNLVATTWYTWLEYTPDTGQFGLLDQNWNRKPSFMSYKTAASKFGAATYKRALSASELGNSAMEGYLFSPNANSLYVLWSNDGVTRSVSIPLSHAQFTDMYGTVTGSAYAGGSGTIPVSVGANPVYVEQLP